MASNPQPGGRGAIFISGDAYVCSGGDGHENTQEKPTGIAGFRLGAPAVEARDVCTGPGFHFESRDDGATCSGTPVSLGPTGRVSLSFCSKQICQIEVILDAPPGDYLDVHRSLRNKLRDKYGSPQVSRKDVDRCSTDAAQCVLAGNASFDIEWRWPTRHAVSLMTKAIDGKASIVVSYVTPEGVTETARPAY